MLFCHFVCFAVFPSLPNQLLGRDVRFLVRLGGQAVVLVKALCQCAGPHWQRCVPAGCRKLGKNVSASDGRKQHVERSRRDTCNWSLLVLSYFHITSVLVLTLRRLMSYIYGAPILDVSRSHTTTQHSR